MASFIWRKKDLRSGLKGGLYIRLGSELTKKLLMGNITCYVVLRILRYAVDMVTAKITERVKLMLPRHAVVVKKGDC